MCILANQMCSGGGSYPEPSVGWYLDVAKNAKSDPTRGTLPNQNHARASLQLSSIGVNKLNPDGSLALDANNQAQLTYDQNVIGGDGVRCDELAPMMLNEVHEPQR
jgi:hypothetical protein